MNHLTPEQLLAELRTIAEKARANNGGVDYTYKRPLEQSPTSCLYVEQNELGQLVPSCIVGHVLAEHEVDLGFVSANLEGAGAGDVLSRLGLIERIPSNNTIAEIANRVQSLQDNGTGWLAAVERVEQNYRDGEFG